MSELPPLLQEVARIAGDAAAIEIARRLGGRSMYVPQNPRANHKLSRVVGAKAAAVIGQHFGGATVAWPKAKGVLNRHDARWLAGRGWSVPRIARQLNLTEHYARSLVQGVERGAETPPDEPTAETCPCCNRRFHTRHAAAPDPRQIPLPLGLD